ncbi:TPA: hypothetical protein JZE15_000549 [Escherichia coli]|nr:hypothetical protein [Escherichia coli]
MRLYIIFLSLFLIAPSSFGIRKNDIIAHDNVSSILNIAGGYDRLFKVEVIGLPYYIFTRANINQSDLEKIYSYKFIIKNIHDSAYNESFTKAFESCRVLKTFPSRNINDLRWGIILYNESNTRIKSIYFDATGNFGAINNTSVSFDCPLYHWLENNFNSPQIDK